MLEFIISIAFAVYSILTVWYKSSLFSALRAGIEPNQEYEWTSEMLMCPMCFGFWTTLLISLIYLFVSVTVVYILAAYGLFLVLNNQWSVK